MEKRNQNQSQQGRQNQPNETQLPNKSKQGLQENREGQNPTKGADKSKSTDTTSAGGQKDGGQSTRQGGYSSEDEQQQVNREQEIMHSDKGTANTDRKDNNKGTQTPKR